MFRCSLCNEIFFDNHHDDKCRDNLYELINNELDKIKCKSILKWFLDIIRNYTNNNNLSLL